MPIIAMTANAFRDDINKADKCGMNDFLLKPVSTEKLVEILVFSIDASKRDN